MALFDQLFARFNPNYLRQASALVILSVGAAVTASLDTNIMERLAWLDTVLKSIHPDVMSTLASITKTALIFQQDEEIREVGGRILEVFMQRLQAEYMRLAEAKPKHPALVKISGLAKQTRDKRSLFH